MRDDFYLHFALSELSKKTLAEIWEILLSIKNAGYWSRSRSLSQKSKCLDSERVFCQTRRFFAVIIALFQGKSTKYGEKLARRQAFGTFGSGF
jgi:hypothetical protein